jgi:hypothetical protein
MRGRENARACIRESERERERDWGERERARDRKREREREREKDRVVLCFIDKPILGGHIRFGECPWGVPGTPCPCTGNLGLFFFGCPCDSQKKKAKVATPEPLPP